MNPDIELRTQGAGSPSVSVVIPCYNEAATIASVVRSVIAQPEVDEVIVIDDGSTDDTPNVLQRLIAEGVQIKLIRHDQNRGKGAALQSGFEKVTKPIVIVQDADLEYDPAEYGILLRPIVEGRADVVFATRFLGAGAHRVLYFWHYVGNKVITTLSNMCTNLNLTDVGAGFKVFKTDILRKIELQENRFSFDTEVTAKIARLEDIRIYEVPISYFGRTYKEGKKIGWRDGVAALWCIMKYNLLSR